MKKKKINSVKFQVRSEFALGVSIAWFSGGLITLFFKEQVSLREVSLIIIGLIASWFFLLLAVQYREKAYGF